jgi:nucleoside-diphosphate-sugar epimerase
MSANVLVTGGCGFIGSHIVEQLVAQNHDVIVFDNLSTGYEKNLDGVKDSITLIRGDITHYDEIHAALHDVNTVFHMAALSYVGESMKKPLEYNDINIGGTLNVLKSCVEQGVEKYLFPSTCIVYGNPSINPVPESEPTKPNSPYGFTKVAGEYYADYYHSVSDLNTMCLRIFNAYGPRMQNRVISIFANLMLDKKPITVNGKGEQERDFVYVDDIATAFIKGFQAPLDTYGKIYNVGTGEGLVLNDMIGQINDYLEANARVNHGPNVSNEIYQLLADTSVAEKELGFSTKVGFEEGLAKTLDFVLEQRK